MKSPTEQVTAAIESVFPMSQQTKQGGKCCGSCCDYRRAVIILSIITIIFGVIGLATGQREVQTEDDELAKDIEEVLDGYATVDLILGIVGIVMAIVALLGAIQFNIYMIGANIFYTAIQFILTVLFGSKAINDVLVVLDEEDYQDFLDDDDYELTESDEEAVENHIRLYLVTTYIISGIITVLWIYPSVMLIKEIKAGIMTRETYPREEYSCCCTSK